MSTFTYEGKDFLLDGKPFRVISGVIHYFRTVPEYWEDRLRKLKACGFNTVETYTCWNLHERKEGVFDFSGSLDFVKYIQIADSLGLKVIVRPGPYICSEFDFGGLPSWLLSYPDINLRCNDPRYLEKVTPYYKEVLSRVAPLQCSKGGPVIMMQVENEYGSYGDDKEYLRALTKLYRECGIDCLLFTSDGAVNFLLERGTLPELPCVGNFGSGVEKNFKILSEFRPNQPLMSGEFWAGWFDHWGEEHHTRPPEETVKNMNQILEAGGSLNFYAFCGGTNFGFTNGANCPDKYEPTVTSYDFSAPVSEAGDLTPTYFAVRDALAKFNGGYCDIPVENLPKKAYGKVALTQKADLFDSLEAIGSVRHSAVPLSMEQVGQDFGYIMYSTELCGEIPDFPIAFENMHDRAHIFVNGKLAGIKDRNGRDDEVKINLAMGEKAKLDILVENCGRVNYGLKLLDKKGIWGGVLIREFFHFGWDITSLPMNNLSNLAYLPDTEYCGKPAFLRGTFAIDEAPADTFIRLDGFHKGFVTINGFNIGRYWNDKGPQKTLYVPAPILRQGENEVIVFETDGWENAQVEFFAEHDLG